MRVYRRWLQPQVISFDLDDTLYDNAPNMIRAESELQAWMSQHHDDFAAMSVSDWSAQRWQVARQHTSLGDDMTALRRKALHQAFAARGFGAATTKRLAEQGFELFLHHRNQFQVADNIVTLLKQLTSRYRVIAITNGNAQPHLIGLDNIFELILYPQAGQYRAKPHADLFRLAEQKLAIKPQQGLHLGDHIVSDVAGAIGAGWQAGWFNPEEVTLKPAQRALALPHFQYRQLQTLVSCLLS
ncbi:HAD-IA family hydrolase [Neiella marina]|uniref:HAD-IA family hydrolase n=1 Tax=Neiella holothuriorum TaxID=2870530 RepID=A0ABS7ECK8_9GAMM|nr:HAD-IA family hydrolase [Neiella holothuriorum]MBW8189959.1 HAD-IA family hydrolase [Neiella holothuriorum]